MTTLGLSFIPESPKFLMTHDKHQRAKEILAFIAKFNKKSTFTMEFHFENETVNTKNPSHGPIIPPDIKSQESFKTRRNLVNLLIMLILWVAASFDYFLISFQLKYIEGDVFINTIVSSSSEITAYMLSAFFYKSLGARLTFMGSFGIAISGAAAY